MDKSDSDQNVHFKTIYVVIRSGLAIVHRIDPRPIDSNQIPYVLIIVSPRSTGSVIDSITGLYVYGTSPEDYLQSEINNLNLLQLLPGTGSTVIEKLQHHYLSLSGETQDEIIHPTEPELNGLYHLNGYNQRTVTIQLPSETDTLDTVVYPRPPSSNRQSNLFQLPSGSDSVLHKVTLSYPGSTDFESFMTAFMAGIGSHLAIFDILKHHQSTIGDPFYPMRIGHPLDNDQPNNLLTQGVGEYLGYHVRTLQGISRGEKSITRVGPTWLSMIDHFWKGFAVCFNAGSLCNPSMAIHDTMIGYCQHQDSKIQALESRFREITLQTNSYLTSIQNQGKTILDQIEMTSKTAQEELTRIATETTELMSKTCQEFETKITNLSTKSTQNIQEERQSTISSIVTLRSDAQKSIHQWTDEGVEQIQSVYSQGFDEISGIKAESLTDVRTERQMSLNLISTEQDRVRNNLENAQREVAKDLAELHNEGVEKNFQMIEDRKIDFLQFNATIIDNIQRLANNRIMEVREIKDQTIKFNQLALAEIDVKIKNARQKLEDAITVGLTNMLDQQNHLTNGVRVDAKKVALEKLRESMDQAVKETLQRLGVGIDQIVQASLQNRVESYLNRLDQEISRASEAVDRIQLSSVGTETTTSEMKNLLAMTKIQQNQLELRIQRMENAIQINQDHCKFTPDPLQPFNLQDRSEVDDQEISLLQNFQSDSDQEIPEYPPETDGEASLLGSPFIKIISESQELDRTFPENNCFVDNLE